MTAHETYAAAFADEGAPAPAPAAAFAETPPPDPFVPSLSREAGASLRPLKLTDIPPEHPVRAFARIYNELREGDHLPDEDDLIHSPEAAALFAWAKHIEPIEVDGGVDFKVLRQGERNALRERRIYRDQWMSETLDSEFVLARYREVVASAVLRRPKFAKSCTPTRERAFLYVLTGVFPVFARNHARLRLFQIEAEPYVLV